MTSCHVHQCCGQPCSSSTGGPLPPPVGDVQARAAHLDVAVLDAGKLGRSRLRSTIAEATRGCGRPAPYAARGRPVGSARGADGVGSWRAARPSGPSQMAVRGAPRFVVGLALARGGRAPPGGPRRARRRPAARRAVVPRRDQGGRGARDQHRDGRRRRGPRQRRRVSRIPISPRTRLRVPTSSTATSRPTTSTGTARTSRGSSPRRRATASGSKVPRPARRSSRSAS